MDIKLLKDEYETWMSEFKKAMQDRINYIDKKTTEKENLQKTIYSELEIDQLIAGKKQISENYDKR